MKRFGRDAWLALILVALLITLTVAAAVRRTKEAEPPAMASFSATKTGTKALRLWLDDLGYATSTDLGADFSLPAGHGRLLIFEPSELITHNDWDKIDAWVKTGSTLVLSGEGFNALLAFNHYDFDVFGLPATVATVTMQTPLLTAPIIPNPLEGKVKQVFNSRRSDFVTHLAVGGRPVLVSIQVGKGQVLLSSAPYLFTNAGLKESANPPLVLNLAAGPQTEPVIFDEWHHGVRPTDQLSSPVEWLLRTPAGHAILFTTVVLFLALLLQGRGFGRPLPLPNETSRRAPLEFITAIANLNRRAGHRHALLQQYLQRLKRDLGRRYRLNPTLPDEAYVAQLAQARPTLDAPALLSLLRRLRRPNVSESELVQLSREASEWMKSAQEKQE